ncbi:MAG: thioredoxin family protein [Chromatiales bacterium]|nr:thioredoxin family protein [Chromatiales bacterium]
MSDGLATVDVAGQTALDALLASTPALLLYLHAPDCGICRVLWPRLRKQLGAAFPQLAFARIDTAAHPDLAAGLMVHSLPAVLLYFEGHEHRRYAHAFGLNEIGAAIGRPYALLFETDD